MIEREDEFPPGFGVDVACGMMGLPPHKFGRGGRRKSFEEERKTVLSFLDKWEPFDWTKDLD